MGQKKYMKKNIHSEESAQNYNMWKGQMRGMYDGLQQQNNLEEMCNDQIEMESEEMMGMAMGMEGEEGAAMPKPQVKSMGMARKQKKGFASKMDDNMSSKMHAGSRFNQQAFKKKK